MPARQLKPKRCKAEGCDTEFTPRSGLQVACSPHCALVLVKQRRKEREAKAHRKARQEFYADHKPTLMKAATRACNAYIRERDKHRPCISCEAIVGQFHAGHYKTVGHAPALRFHEHNIHKQCAQCNNFKSGNIPGYRPNLVHRIGEAAVQELERDHPPQKLTVTDLKEIAWWFKEKKRWLVEADPN